MKDNANYLAILVSRENHRKLALLANKTQTFNDIVSDLITLHEQLKLKDKDKT